MELKVRYGEKEKNRTRSQSRGSGVLAGLLDAEETAVCCISCNRMTDLHGDGASHALVDAVRLGSQPATLFPQPLQLLCKLA